MIWTESKIQRIKCAIKTALALNVWFVDLLIAIGNLHLTKFMLIVLSLSEEINLLPLAAAYTPTVTSARAGIASGTGKLIKEDNKQADQKVRHHFQGGPSTTDPFSRFIEVIASK
jgi:hypothetical protein